MAVNNENKNVISKILKLLYYIAISFVCLIVIFLLYYIISSQIHSDDENYKPFISIYTIVSPSMTPVIEVYDVVINVKVDDPTDIEIGDIITYKSAASTSEGMTITHRVVEISQLPDGTYEYMTQGDNNSEPDSVYVTYDNVIGKEIMIIPYLGRIQFLIANQKGWLFLLLIPVVIYLIHEIIKLIDLFNLRKKVDKVVGTTEENIIVQKKYEKIKNEERKEQIKQELYFNEVTKSSKNRYEKEPDGFLEKYKETIVNVKENKYNKITPNKKEEIVSTPEEVSLQPDIPVIERKENPRPKKKINEQYEILDTDELTSKIKEYDAKIGKLDQMIKDMENISNEPIKKSNKQENIEVDNFLQGQKIKVVNVEETKNQPKTPNKSSRYFKNKASNYKKDISIELNNIIPSENPNKKINRPDSIDIKDIKETKASSKNKKELNLKPDKIKKVNRAPKTSSSSDTKETKEKSKLNLNPKKIKKINRPTKTKKTTKKETSKDSSSKKRQPLIVIEKRK